MAGPKLGRQRMAIAAEGASAQSHVEIVKAAKSPAVLDLLGGSLGIAWHICVIAVTLSQQCTLPHEQQPADLGDMGHTVSQTTLLFVHC